MPDFGKAGGIIWLADFDKRNHAHGVMRGEMDEMVIYASGFQRLSPCGACRQVMIELMAPDALVHCCNEGGEVSSWSLVQLFPEPFVLE